MDPVSAAFTGLRIAVDGLKGASETLDKAKVESAAAEVRTALIAAQEVTLRLQEDATTHYKGKAALEKQIVELTASLNQLDDWKMKASCYTLATTQPNSLTFVREFDAKKGKEHGIEEPFHWACPSCFEKRQRSILYQETTSTRFVKCPTCDFKVEMRPAQRHQSFPESTYESFT